VIWLAAHVGYRRLRRNSFQFRTMSALDEIYFRVFVLMSAKRSATAMVS
jgi:hypothetical protein